MSPLSLFSDLAPEVIFCIFACCDISSVVAAGKTCCYLHNLAFDRSVWQNLLGDLQRRSILDRTGAPLDTLSTDQMIELVQRVITGPTTWSPQEPDCDSFTEVSKTITLHPQSEVVTPAVPPPSCRVTRNFCQAGVMFSSPAGDATVPEFAAEETDVESAIVMICVYTQPSNAVRLNYVEIVSLNLRTGTATPLLAARAPGSGFRKPFYNPLILGPLAAVKIGAGLDMHMIINWRTQSYLILQAPPHETLQIALISQYILLMTRPQSLTGKHLHLVANETLHAHWAPTIGFNAPVEFSPLVVEDIPKCSTFLHTDDQPGHRITLGEFNLLSALYSSQPRAAMGAADSVGGFGTLASSRAVLWSHPLPPATLPWLCSFHDRQTSIPHMSFCLPPNPDISGLGVRISFYVQTIALGKEDPPLVLILVLLTARSLDEALNSVWTLLGTSLGLTISALVTAAGNQLTLYQAVVVTDLIWLANWAIFMALATYNRHPHGSHAVQYSAIGQTYISMACILYLWARAPTLDAGFSGTPGETVFVVLFISTNATGAGRTIALVVTTLLLIGYTFVAALFLSRRLSSTLNLKPKHKHKHTSIPLQRRGSTGSLPQPAPSNALPGPRPSTGAMRTRLPPSLALDPHLIILGLFSLVPYVITVGSTELQIRRNQLCPDNAFWGFGQILAMTVTIVPVSVTVQAFRKYGWKQRPRVPPENGRGSVDDVHV
ncbi:F-box domain-containing protein [Mycena sanguinolenta]|uniref:F-box domain-containing protein n=1 Tax=Mycena sanguinolenta TaxID=230812 RepID=A0A8H6Y389_9AGAR|nr:F-box domain-containing protein [Mycena sanguinolenta]